MAFLVMGPASALTASGPHAALCVGGEADGKFETQEVNLTIPGAGLGLGNSLCVNLSPNAVGEWLTGVSENLAEAEPPSEPPTPEQIESAIDRIADADPTNPLAALFLADGLCQDFNISPQCNAIVGGALAAPSPTGDLALEHSGSCFSGEQSGSGTYNAFGSARYNLDYTIDYASLGGLAGVISGNAENTQFGDPNRGEVTDLSGVYLPGCGSGAKVALIHIG